jgi:predicted dehydrogenase
LAGGGPLMDVGIYALQATRYITGEEPTLVTAVESTIDHVKFNSVEESIAWQLKFPSGVIASCDSSYNFNGMNRYQAFADNGWFQLSPAYGYGGIEGKRSDGELIKFPGMDQFAAEMDNFAECILKNQPTKVPGEEGLRDVKILMAIYEAARTGKAVNLA